MKMFGRVKRNWVVPAGQEPTELDKKVIAYQNKGILCPRRDMIRTPEQIEGIRRAGLLNTAVLDLVAANIKEGISTLALDDLIGEYTRAHGGVCACLGYEGYPKNSCISVDDVVCHGIPNANTILKKGDIVNVDCTTILDGYYADASRMFVIGGETTPEKQRLVDVTKECLDLSFEVCKPYTTVGDLGYAIQKHAEENGYSIVRELCGHGVGLKFHELPEVCHYGRRGDGMLLVPGMTFTIEPMVNMGKRNVTFDRMDGWTCRTADGLPSAQWEHTFLMTENGLEVLTY